MSSFSCSDVVLQDSLQSRIEASLHREFGFIGAACQLDVASGPAGYELKILPGSSLIPSADAFSFLKRHLLLIDKICQSFKIKRFSIAKVKNQGSLSWECGYWDIFTSESSPVDGIHRNFYLYSLAQERMLLLSEEMGQGAQIYTRKSSESGLFPVSPPIPSYEHGEWREVSYSRFSSDGESVVQALEMAISWKGGFPTTVLGCFRQESNQEVASFKS